MAIQFAAQCPSGCGTTLAYGLRTVDDHAFGVQLVAWRGSDLLGRNALVRDQEDDPLDEREGLPRSRAGDDEHGAVSREDGLELLRIGSTISLARALSFNGLANAFSVVAINGGRHVAPAFAGDTIYAWTEVIEKLILPGRADIGALRLRTVATKDQSCADFPLRTADGSYAPSVLLDFDYTVLIPRHL